MRRDEEGRQYLSFFLGGEEYAVEILRIREVVEYERLTPVPTTPDWVRGVMNLRGTVVPVLDLARKLAGRGTEVAKTTCIVIFDVDHEGELAAMGVMIDAVGRVLELGDDQVQEPPAFGCPVRVDLLEGMGMVDDQPIPILDIQRVLTERELGEVATGVEAGVRADGDRGSTRDPGSPAAAPSAEVSEGMEEGAG